MSYSDTFLDTPPQPGIDPDTVGFWEAAAEGHLAICRCQSCKLWMQPPLERCRKCAAVTAFEKVSGTGFVYSFVVQRQGAVVGYFKDLPYVVALVELDEQPELRLPTRIVGCEPEAVSVGMRVQVSLQALPGGDVKVPVFSPIAG